MTWKNVIPKQIDHEHRHQRTIITWAAGSRYKYPELAMLYAVPNAKHGGTDRARQGAYFKDKGLKSGQPDLTLPVARRGYHSLYIELKAPKTSVSEKTYPSKLQRAVGRALAAEGNLAVICWGQGAAINVLEWYLDPHKHTIGKPQGLHLNNFENVEVLQKNERVMKGDPS